MPRISLLKFVCVTWIMMIVALPAQAEKPAQESDSMIYELRTYTTPPGKLPALHDRFRNHTVDLFKKHGMTNVIYWTPTDQPNTLIYLLAHESEKARDESFAAFRADPKWIKVKSETEADGSLTTKVESLLLKPTDYTPAEKVAEIFKDKPGQVFELRTYTTEEGKLPNLNARFRDHTTKLFEKHGMTNVVYTTPVDEKLKDNTLVYVISHESPEAAQASWKAFGSDPAWKKVAEESQVDGQILVKGGVKRVYLKPTDFSPVK